MNIRVQVTYTIPSDHIHFRWFIGTRVLDGETTQGAMERCVQEFHRVKGHERPTVTAVDGWPA